LSSVVRVGRSDRNGEEGFFSGGRGDNEGKMIVSTFFKIIEVGLVGGEGSLFWGGVDVG